MQTLQTGSTREKRYTEKENGGLTGNDGTRENRDKQGKCGLAAWRVMMELIHRLNMKLDLQRLFGLLFTAVLIG
jgi:hypothetical protein